MQVQMMRSCWRVWQRLFSVVVDLFGVCGCGCGVVIDAGACPKMYPQYTRVALRAVYVEPCWCGCANRCKGCWSRCSDRCRQG
jgi:hypothetical protein